MRAVIFLYTCVFVVVGQDINAMMSMPKYDERYDYLDVDDIFRNKRLVRNYVDCLINAQRCTPEGKALKRILPEALRTKCIRCTERQKRTSVKVIRRLKNEYPEEWAKLASRWDPTGDFTRYFEDYLAKEHFNTIPGSGPTVNVLSLQTTPPPPPPPPSRPASVFTNPPPPVMSTSPRPVVLNRFGGDGELMVGSSLPGVATTKPLTETTMKPTTTKPTTNMRPAFPTRPSPSTWSSAGSNVFPTRFTLRPSGIDLSPPYSTAITLIDQIGYKIIRTTELVTDLLRDTVRAVVG
ncbi:chemosensory protein 9 isoform X1 [Bombyx mori]|uniref:Uncharacterized protein n=1 Tax=Bombyx mori TaxID=7091 RepID=A0A8R2GBI7_BOMMO|nr:chemosensory protein 9 isoform X1 [Bombyx mori]